MILYSHQEQTLLSRIWWFKLASYCYTTVTRNNFVFTVFTMRLTNQYKYSKSVDLKQIFSWV